MNKDFFDIRGRWESWKIGNRTAANSPMPESPIHAVLAPMPRSEIKPVNIDFAKLAENSGCINLFGWFYKPRG